MSQALTLCFPFSLRRHLPIWKLNLVHALKFAKTVAVGLTVVMACQGYDVIPDDDDIRVITSAHPWPLSYKVRRRGKFGKGHSWHNDTPIYVHCQQNNRFSGCFVGLFLIR